MVEKVCKVGFLSYIITTRGVAWSSDQRRSLSLQGSRVRIPSPTFPFEECIVRGEEDEEERRRGRRRTRTCKTRRTGMTARAFESGTATRKASVCFKEND